MLNALGETCEEMRHNADTFARLSQKKDKKAATRASAASQSAWWAAQATQCLAARASVALPPPPTVLPPILPPVLPPSPLQPPTYPTYYPPTGGGGGGGFPYYQMQSESGPVLTPIDEVYGTGAEDDAVLADGGQAPRMPRVPGRVAPVQATGEADECVYSGQLPLQYADEFGPMNVLQIVCAGAAAVQGDEGGSAFDAGPIGPVESGEIASMEAGDAGGDGLSGLDFIGLGRHLG